MGTEVIQHKVIRAKVPGGKRVYRVRFHSDHVDSRPVEAFWPWPHPWWCTGTFETGNGDGCVIVAYTEDPELLKKGWPEARDLEIFESDLDHYTFTDRFQPNDDWIEKHLPKVWGEWAHCGFAHRWQLILRETRELGIATIEDVVTGAMPTKHLPDPTPDDFLIWWLTPDQVRDMAEREDVGRLSNWPEYLRSEVRSLVGRNPKGQLWVNPDHMKICPSVDPVRCELIDETEGGICFLRRDRALVEKTTGYITDFKMNLLHRRGRDLGPGHFRIWWMTPDEAFKVKQSVGCADEPWPKHIRSELSNIAHKVGLGQDVAGVWVSPMFEHIEIINKTDVAKFPGGKVGIAFMVDDIAFVRRHPGVITDHLLNVSETYEHLPSGVTIGTF